MPGVVDSARVVARRAESPSRIIDKRDKSREYAGFDVATLGAGMPRSTQDAVLVALDAVVEALVESREPTERILHQADVVRRKRREGHSYIDILVQAARPLIVEQLSMRLSEIARVGHHLRIAEARALYEEGLTMDRIAELFGVSRQRISALLNDAPNEEASPATPQRSLPNRRPARRGSRPPKS